MRRNLNMDDPSISAALRLHSPMWLENVRRARAMTMAERRYRRLRTRCIVLAIAAAASFAWCMWQMWGVGR